MLSKNKYSIFFSSSAKKEFFKLPDDIQRRIVQPIDNLEYEPRPSRSKKLSGKKEEIFRIRIGDYRVVYEIDDTNTSILITRVGHRKDIYK